MMASSPSLFPNINDRNKCFESSKTMTDRYAIHDYGQGSRLYSYELDLVDYEPEEITVIPDEHGKLRIRAYRSPCHEFRREYNLGGSNVEAKLIRNTIDGYGRLRVDVAVRPRRNNLSSTNTNILTFDLQGYPPSNITVRLSENGLLKINAQHTDDKTEHCITREYYRQHQLPKSIRPDQIHAKFDDHQMLTIEVPQIPKKKKLSWQLYCDKTKSKHRNKTSNKNSKFCRIM